MKSTARKSKKRGQNDGASIVVERFLPESCPNCARRFLKWGTDYRPWEVVREETPDRTSRRFEAGREIGAMHSALDNILCLYCKNVTARLLLRRDVLRSRLIAMASINLGAFTAWGIASEVMSKGRPVRQVLLVRTRRPGGRSKERKARC